MKKVFLAVSLVAAFILSACSGPKDGVHKLDILQTDDIHGKYFDSLYVNRKINPYSLANVSTYVKNLRQRGMNPILIDVGDNLQGDNASYYFNYVDTVSRHIFPRMAKYIGYDVMVVGNHDIETGHAVYDRIRKELEPVPYLAGNAIRTDGSQEPYFESYTIVRRNGVKIAVIGFTNPNISSWLSPATYKGMNFAPILPLAQKVIDKVIEEHHPHLVIFAAHIGSGAGSLDDIENAGILAAKTLHGVDIVLGAHDHRERCEFVDGQDGTRVLFMNGGARAQVVNHAVVELRIKKGQVVGKKISGKTIPMKGVPVDEDFIAAFREDYLNVQAFTSRVAGYLTDDISMDKALDGPSEYVNLIHRVQLAASGADISIAAPLTPHGTIEAGDLDYQDMTTIYPYENQLYTLSLTGKRIKDYLEYSYKHWIAGDVPSFDFDSAEGIIYDVYRNHPDGSRVEIKSMSDGSAFDLSKEYTVAFTSYRASGAGGMLTNGAGIEKDELPSFVTGRFPEIRDLIYEYVQKNGTITPQMQTNWKFVE